MRGVIPKGSYEKYREWASHSRRKYKGAYGRNFIQLLGENEHLFHKEIKVWFTKINYEEAAQLSLFGLRNKSHVKLGAFLELLTTAIFGGSMLDTLVYIDNYYSKKGDSPAIKPDVFNKETDEAYESKGVRVGHEHNISDDQLDKYKMYQRMHPKRKIYYIFWRHTLKAIRSFKGDIKELHRKLSKEIRLGQVVPLSVVDKLHRHPTIGRRYQLGEKWQDCTRVSSGTLNRMFTETESMLEKMGFMDVRKRFVIKRMYTPELIIEGQKVLGIPIHIIKDRGHKNWVQDLIDEPPF